MALTIGTRLILATSLTTAVVIGLMAWTVQRAHSRQFRFERARSANQLSEVIQRSTRVDMLENRRERLHEQIRALGSLHQEGIRKVRLFNKEGRIMFSSDPSEIGKSVDTRGEACYACHAEGRPLERLGIGERVRTFAASDGTPMLGIIAPIPNEPSCATAACHAHNPSQRVLGVLDVNLSMAEAEAELSQDQKILTTLTLLAIFASAGILAWLTRRFVRKPVASLVEGTRALAAGNLGATIPSSGDHELADLAKAFNDMSRRLAEIQQQLTHADRLASVGRLAAGVAHEINNPLTGVLSYASLLQKRFAADPSASEDLAVVVRETKRVREIVRQLLDFARPATPRHQKVSLQELIRHACAVVSAQVEAQGARLILDLEPDMPDLDLDPGQIEQVLVNLLLNALDALDKPEGLIEVHASRMNGDVVRLDVKDNGSGIDPEDLPRLFDPFFSTKGPKGTGLGLAVSWAMVQAHGGRIQASSKRGSGSVFSITLPLAQPGMRPMLPSDGPELLEEQP